MNEGKAAPPNNRLGRHVYLQYLEIVSPVVLLLLSGILLASCGRASPQSQRSTPASVQTPVRVGISHIAPKLKTVVRPRLPDAAKQLGVTGPVVMQIKIDPAGNVSEPRVIRGHTELNTVATEAVMRWKYEPYIFEGRPIPLVITVLVNFEDH